MTKRATVADFPIGCTVKIMRLPKSHWRIVGGYPNVVGEIGTVAGHYPREGDSDGPWVVVKLGLFDSGNVYRPWWLECGRVEWIPEVSE